MRGYIRPSVAVSSKSDRLPLLFGPLDQILDADDGPRNKRVGGVIAHSMAPILKCHTGDMPHRPSIGLIDLYMKLLLFRKKCLKLGKQRTDREVKLAYGPGQVVESVIGRRRVRDGQLVHFGGYAFGEGFVEIIITADELEEEIEEAEAVQGARLALFGEYQDGEEGLEGRVSCAESLELL
jgi:hypothetical protein